MNYQASLPRKLIFVLLKFVVLSFILGAPPAFSSDETDDSEDITLSVAYSPNNKLIEVSKRLEFDLESREIRSSQLAQAKSLYVEIWRNLRVSNELKGKHAQLLNSLAADLPKLDRNALTISLVNSIDIAAQLEQSPFASRLNNVLAILSPNLAGYMGTELGVPKIDDASFNSPIDIIDLKDGQVPQVLTSKISGLQIGKKSPGIERVMDREDSNSKYTKNDRITGALIGCATMGLAAAGAISNVSKGGKQGKILGAIAGATLGCMTGAKLGYENPSRAGVEPKGTVTSTRVESVRSGDGRLVETKVHYSQTDYKTGVTKEWSRSSFEDENSTRTDEEPDDLPEPEEKSDDNEQGNEKGNDDENEDKSADEVDEDNRDNNDNEDQIWDNVDRDVSEDHIWDDDTSIETAEETTGTPIQDEENDESTERITRLLEILTIRDKLIETFIRRLLVDRPLNEELDHGEIAGIDSAVENIRTKWNSRKITKKNSALNTSRILERGKVERSFFNPMKDPMKPE